MRRHSDGGLDSCRYLNVLVWRFVPWSASTGWDGAGEEDAPRLPQKGNCCGPVCLLENKLCILIHLGCVFRGTGACGVAWLAVPPLGMWEEQDWACRGRHLRSFCFVNTDFIIYFVSCVSAQIAGTGR